jgi:hypothetical protein
MPQIDSVVDYPANGPDAAQFRRLAGGYTNTQSGTTYTLLSSDNGAVIQFTNANPITVTIASGLGANFYCTLIQWGAGQITVSPDTGVTRNSEDSQYKTAGQYAGIDLFAVSADTFWMGGSTAA